MIALIDIAADHGCTISDVVERFSSLELQFWLVRYMNKMGYTYDTEKIRKARVDAFMQRARKSWVTEK